MTDVTFSWDIYAFPVTQPRIHHSAISFLIARMADKDAVFDDISKFDASKLKKTETKEKNPLPTKESKLCIRCLICKK